MFCSNCSAWLPQAGKFCSCCGKRIYSSLEDFRRAVRKTEKDFIKRQEEKVPRRQSLMARQLASACGHACAFKIGDPVVRVNDVCFPLPNAYEILSDIEQRAEKLFNRLIAANDF